MKSDVLGYIEKRIAQCESCPLCRSRKNTVPGTGNPVADVVVVGEAPTREDDELGVPFVGPAGKLLEDFINTIGHDSSKWYFANLVKCYPPGDRKPYDVEIEICKQYLLKQLGIIRPKVIVSLGRATTHVLLDTKEPIGDLRRQFIDFRYFDALVFPTYSPSYYIHQMSKVNLGYNDFYRLRGKLSELRIRP